MSLGSWTPWTWDWNVWIVAKSRWRGCIVQQGAFTSCSISGRVINLLALGLDSDEFGEFDVPHGPPESAFLGVGRWQ